MDLQFWSQFCTSPVPDGSDLSDLDSSPGWSPLSAFDDQENFCSPGGFNPHHQHPNNTPSFNTPVSDIGSPPSFLQGENQHHHLATQRRSHSKNPVKRVQQRTAANHRERKRMRTINEAFEGLRSRVPLASGDRKLSKVDTLRLAIRYIHHLTDMVTACGEVNGNMKNSTEENAAKVIIRCHGAAPGDYYGDANGGIPLYGHSLSWTDEKRPKVGPNGRLVAKLWVPESADPSTTVSNNYECEDMPL